MQALIQLAPMIVVFAVFYFLLIRPQQQKQKKHQELVSNLKKGDKVVTVSGLHGTVTGFKGDRVVILKVANNVEVEFLREAVSYLRTEGKTNEKTKDDKKEEPTPEATPEPEENKE